MGDTKIRDTDILPKEIILEVTNRCNLRCRFCHFHGAAVEKKRPTGFMEPVLWRKILDELNAWKTPFTLLTHGAGEPLLYPHLAELLTAAKKIPEAAVGFMTNGMLLDKKWAAFLVDHQIDWLAFSVDGTNPVTHDYFRVNADLNVIEQNIFHLINEKITKNSMFPLLRFNMVAYPEILDQVDGYVEKWLPHAESVCAARFRPVGSRRLWPEGGDPGEFYPCPLLYHQMVVSYDGRVGLCCEDIHGEVVLGDANKESLAAIFNNSQVALKYRKDQENKAVDQLFLCRDCDVWGGDIALKKEILSLRGHRVNKTVTPAFTLFEKNRSVQ